MTTKIITANRHSSPFTDQGSVMDIFPDLSVWQGIHAVIRQINTNASVT